LTVPGTRPIARPFGTVG